MTRWGSTRSVSAADAASVPEVVPVPEAVPVPVPEAE